MNIIQKYTKIEKSELMLTTTTINILFLCVWCNWYCYYTTTTTATAASSSTTTTILVLLLIILQQLLQVYIRWMTTLAADEICAQSVVARTVYSPSSSAATLIIINACTRPSALDSSFMLSLATTSTPLRNLATVVNNNNEHWNNENRQVRLETAFP